MHILILEDSAHRIAWFKAALKEHKLIFCAHARAAKQALRKNQFDLIFLDHDLHGEPVDPESENSGCEVAHYIAEHEIESIVVIHSENPLGSDAMAAILENSYVIPYSKLKKLGMREVMKLINVESDKE
jgi:CheY-like chemotaxis protein